MKLSVKTQSQRSSAWGNEILGYNTSSAYNIYNYGCLITSFGNYIGKNPSEVNKILKDGGGYVAGTGNFIWSKCTLLGIKETYVSPYYSDPVTTQGINKIIEYIQNGYPLICKVDFNPSTSTEEQHYVLLAGYDETGNILVVDPWEGQWETWSTDACKRNIYQFRAYDKSLQISEQIDLQKELDKCRIERDQNWNKFISLCDALGVGANADQAIAEIHKLTELEDKYNEKEKENATLKAKIEELETKLTNVSFAHTELVSKYQTLEETKLDMQKTMNEQGSTIQSLSTSIQELKKQLQTEKTGWQLIADGISKILKGGE